MGEGKKEKIGDDGLSLIFKGVRINKKKGGIVKCKDMGI